MVKIPIDDMRSAMPLFEGFGDSIPTSPKQFDVRPIPLARALALNDAWHSRLPKLTNPQGCFSFCAEFKGSCFAVAIWGHPVARAYNDKNFVELRRMAIVDEAPRFTATFMLGWMLRWLRRETDYVRAISYQDTEVHQGTIYKASNWKGTAVKGTPWDRPGHNRKRNSWNIGDKVRWEYDLDR